MELLLNWKAERSLEEDFEEGSVLFDVPPHRVKSQIQVDGIDYRDSLCKLRSSCINLLFSSEARKGDPSVDCILDFIALICSSSVVYRLFWVVGLFFCTWVVSIDALVTLLAWL